MKAAALVLAVALVAWLCFSVVDSLGLADKWAAERAAAEAERAAALAALRQAEGDALLKSAAARAVEADTTVATAAAFTPLIIALCFLCYALPVLGGLYLWWRYGKQDGDGDV